jgi:hypothetical protein
MTALAQQDPLAELRDRLAKFSLKLADQTTRLIESEATPPSDGKARGVGRPKTCVVPQAALLPIGRMICNVREASAAWLEAVRPLQ